jgi:putative ABC transport system permease protein
VLLSSQTVKVKNSNSQTSNSQNPTQDSLSQPMLVGSSQTLTVIGVVRRVAFGYLYPLERGLLIPLPVAQELLIPSDTPFGRKVSRIFLEAKPDETIEQVTFQAVNLLKRRHQVTKQSDFFVGNAQEEINIYNSIAKGMTVFLGFVAAISLVVGGINIMNIMLVSVKERTREIGLRMAIGASEEVILIQFVIEALTISMVGGLLGIGLGTGLASLIATFSPLKPEVTPLSVVLAVGVAGGIGFFFGIFPAQQAAKLDPITALRTE